MLEEPNYSNVVRWGNDGTSFVVLEVSGSSYSFMWSHFPILEADVSSYGDADNRYSQ